MRARNRTLLGLLAILGLSLAAVSVVPADDAKPEKKGTNTQEAAKDAKATAETKAIQDLELADRLIRYGRQEKNAESLLLAAQILQKTATQQLKSERKATGDVEKTKSPKMMDNSPKGLLAEAKKMSSTPQVEALAMATEKILDETTRGAARGPQVDNFTIFSLQTVTWNPISFRAGEFADVYISTGSFSNMILEVTDENGNLVARDSAPGNYYRCSWTPRWTGSFRIRLVNNNTLAFNCRLTTN